MSSRYRTSLAPGANLGTLQAVRVALDPEMPADTGVYGVIGMNNSVYSIAAVPLVTNRDKVTSERSCLASASTACTSKQRAAPSAVTSPSRRQID